MKLIADGGKESSRIPIGAPHAYRPIGEMPTCTAYVRYPHYGHRPQEYGLDFHTSNRIPYGNDRVTWAVTSGTNWRVQNVRFDEILSGGFVPPAKVVPVEEVRPVIQHTRDMDEYDLAPYPYHRLSYAVSARSNARWVSLGVEPTRVWPAGRTGPGSYGLPRTIFAENKQRFAELQRTLVK